MFPHNVSRATLALALALAARIAADGRPDACGPTTSTSAGQG